MRESAYAEPTQNHELGLVTFSFTHSVGGFDEFCQLGRRVVCGHSSGTVSQEILPVLEAHAGRSQSTAEGVFQVVDADLWQTDGLSDSTPGTVQHPLYRLAFVGEYVRAVFAATRTHYGAGNVVQDNQSLVAVLDERSRYDEHEGIQFWNLDLPAPLQLADFGIAAACVDGEQCHAAGHLYTQYGLVFRCILHRDTENKRFLACLCSSSHMVPQYSVIGSNPTDLTLEGVFDLKRDGGYKARRNYRIVAVLLVAISVKSPKLP